LNRHFPGIQCWDARFYASDHIQHGPSRMRTSGEIFSRFCYTVDLWSSSLLLFSLLVRSAPHDLEVVLMSESSSLPALLPSRLWSHRTGATDWEETAAAAAWEETRATTAWDVGNLGGDGAVAWRLRRCRSSSPHPLCSLLAHDHVAWGASRLSSPAVHTSSSRSSSRSSPPFPAELGASDSGTVDVIGSEA
jgi:hypothetical protein